MPGTPATTPNLAIPRYAATDAADFPLQANAISDRIDKLGPSMLTGFAPAFPASPVEGQIVDYVSNALVWRLRYTTSAPGVDKWVFIGGGWKRNSPFTASQYVIPDDTAVHDDPVLKVDVPWRGTWEVAAVINVGGYGSSSNNVVIQEAGSGFLLNESFTPNTSHVGAPYGGSEAPLTIAAYSLTVTSPKTIVVAYKKVNAANVLVRNMATGECWLKLRPIAVS